MQHMRFGGATSSPGRPAPRRFQAGPQKSLIDLDSAEAAVYEAKLRTYFVGVIHNYGCVHTHRPWIREHQERHRIDPRASED